MKTINRKTIQVLIIFIAGAIAQGQDETINGHLTVLSNLTVHGDTVLSNLTVHGDLLVGTTNVLTTLNSVSNSLYASITNEAAIRAQEDVRLQNNLNSASNSLYASITNEAAVRAAEDQAIRQTMTNRLDNQNGSFWAGGAAQPTNKNAIAIGNNATVGSDGSIAIGSGSVARSSVAIGVNAQALGLKTVSLGDNSKASGDYSVALGNKAEASGNKSVALGNEAKASGNNSVALGNGSIAQEDNTVSVGSDAKKRRIVNVADGRDDFDVANMKQLRAEENARKAKDAEHDRRLDEHRKEIDQHRTEIRRLNDEFTKIKQKTYGGIAAAAALGTFMPSDERKALVTAGLGYYEGEAALGINGTYRVFKDEKLGVYVNAGIGFSTESTVLPRVMVGVEF